MNKFASITLGLMAILILSTSGITASFAANDKITICHRTDSATNPYVQITVDPNAADEDTGNDNGQGDHAAEHQGPVPENEQEAQALKDAHIEWGDIIPPHDNFAGLNWTTEGQAIYNNGCNYTSVTPTTTPSETISPSISVSVSPTEEVTATPTPTDICRGASCNTGGGDNPTPTASNAASPTPTAIISTNIPNPTATEAPRGGINQTTTPTQIPGATTAPTTAPEENAQPEEKVLGAATMAPTGSFTQNLMNLLGTFGMILAAAGYKSYRSDRA